MSPIPETACAVCGEVKPLAATIDTWFFVAGPTGSQHLCSRECLVRWVEGKGRADSLTRLKNGGYHIIRPHRRE